jgi:hypothetical protein
LIKNIGVKVISLTYDWVDNDGYNNIGEWIEKEAEEEER